MAAYRLQAGGGVIRVADGAFIPADTRNRDWNTYLAWEAVPNTPDPAISPTLSDYKTSQRAAVDAEADRRAQIAAPLRPIDVLRFAEARRADADGSPTAGEHPLTNARAVAESISIATAADATIADEVAGCLAIADIEEARILGRAAITAAGSIAAVDAAVAAIVWP